MSAMASQVISLTIVYSTVYSGADQRTSKLRVTGLCVGNSPVTGEFPTQRASNAENASIWWRHHVLWPARSRVLGFRISQAVLFIWGMIGVSDSSQWHHYERDGVWNHRRLDCSLNRLFSRSKKTPNLRVTGLCEGNCPVTGEFPLQRASKAENAYIWWRHHVYHLVVFGLVEVERRLDHHLFSPRYLLCSYINLYTMMTPSNWNIFRVTGPLWGNPPATGEFPSQRPVTRSDAIFDLGLNK